MAIVATYRFHSLVIGKMEIGIFFCLIGDIWSFMTEMFTE